ncbi:MAG: hypothetical protein Q7K40_05125 [bacterium]|nr:hypothetical protein [bacterium]
MRNKGFTPPPTFTNIENGFIAGWLQKWRGRQFSSRKKLVGGFTLVEMVIYAGVLGVLGVLSINSTLIMTRAFTDLRVSRDLNSSATALFERLTRDIRGAKSINLSSTFDSSTGWLTLDTEDLSGTATTVEYYIEDSLVKIREGGVAQGAIMTPKTTITNFYLRRLINTNSEAIKIEATISATRGDITKTRKFYSTVVMRESY